MSESANRKRSLVAGIICGLVGGSTGLALCVLLSRPSGGDRNSRHVQEISATPILGPGSPQLSDLPRVQNLTVEDLTRCHHALFGELFPEPVVPGVATVASPIARPALSVAPSTASDLSLCLSKLNSLAGNGNGE
jgi:hypothetical protein